MGVVFVGDVGTRFILECGENVSAATVRRIYYQKFDGATGYWAATPHPTEVTQIYYDTKDGDLDVSGKWKFQSYVELAAWQGFGELAELTIYTPINVT